MAKNQAGKTSRVTRGNSSDRHKNNSGNRHRSNSGDRQPRRSSSDRGAKRTSLSVSPYPDRKKGRNAKRTSSISSHPDQTKNAKRVRFDTEQSSSEKSKNVQDPATEIKKRTFQGRPADYHCWLCRGMTDEYFCPDCPRVYHTKCLRRIKFGQSEPVCECKWRSIDGPRSKPNITVDLKDLLQIVLKNVCDDKSKKKNKEANTDFIMQLKYWPESEENKKLWELIDIAYIIDKVNLCEYKYPNAFFQDVKRLTYNCQVIFGNDDVKTLTAQKFEKAVKQQLSDLEACGECYLLKCSEYPNHDFFADLCSTPHTIVWAKLKGFPYWPAKCLRIVNDHADVRFFGTHDRSLLPLSQVYRMSRRNPGGNPKKPKNSSRMTSYEESMSELNAYICNYQNTYGSFRYYNDKTPLLSEKSSGKKGNKKQSQNVLEDAMEQDVNDFNDQHPPQLTVSLLHDDFIEFDCKSNGLRTDDDEVEASEPSPSISSYLAKDAYNNCSYAAEVKADILHLSPKPTTESTILCQMTFDEERNSEILFQNEMTDEENLSSSLPTSELPAQMADRNLFNIDGSSDNSAGPSSSIQDNLRASTSSPQLIITSTQSLSHENVESRSPSDENHLSAESTSFIEEDEVQYISESVRVPVVDSDENKNVHPIIKTFAELLFSNKPHMRNSIRLFNTCAMKTFLTLWVEAQATPFDITQFNLFFKYCAKLIKSAEELKAENKLLKSQLEKEKCSAKKVKLRDVLIQSQAAKNANDLQYLLNEKMNMLSAMGNINKRNKLLKENLTVCLKENEKLKNQIVDKERLLNTMNEQLSNKAQQIDNLNRQLSEEQNLISDLKEKLNEKDQIKKQLQETMIQNNRMKLEIEERENFIRDLELKVYEKERESQHADVKLKALRHNFCSKVLECRLPEDEQPKQQEPSGIKSVAISTNEAYIDDGSTITEVCKTVTTKEVTNIQGIMQPMNILRLTPNPPLPNPCSESYQVPAQQIPQPQSVIAIVPQLYSMPYVQTYQRVTSESTKVCFQSSLQPQQSNEEESSASDAQPSIEDVNDAQPNIEDANDAEPNAEDTIDAQSNAEDVQPNAEDANEAELNAKVASVAQTNVGKRSRKRRRKN